MGITAAAEAATKSTGSSLTFPILIVLVFVGFYFLMIRPQRRRQQQVQQQQRTVEPGAQVRTTAGMYATVVEVDGDDVVLEVAPGVEVRYLKRAIMEVIAPGDAEATEDGGFSKRTEPPTTSAALIQLRKVSRTLTTTTWPSRTRATRSEPWAGVRLLRVNG
jgi:preprotein translocase subunit YajC